MLYSYACTFYYLYLHCFNVCETDEAFNQHGVDTCNYNELQTTFSFSQLLNHFVQTLHKVHLHERHFDFSLEDLTCNGSYFYSLLPSTIL